MATHEIEAVSGLKAKSTARAQTANHTQVSLKALTQHLLPQQISAPSFSFKNRCHSGQIHLRSALQITKHNSGPTSYKSTSTP